MVVLPYKLFWKASTCRSAMKFTHSVQPVTVVALVLPNDLGMWQIRIITILNGLHIDTRLELLIVSLQSCTSNSHECMGVK